MAIFDPFTSHPASVGESYGEHFAYATTVGGRMVLGGLACMIHGLFPFLFTRTGSRTILALHHRIMSGARAPISRRLTAEIAERQSA
ncbi:MAG: DUF6356 family protein [Alphaproteobacteria bacterium]